MKSSCLVLVIALLGCAAPRDAKEVKVMEGPKSLERRLDIDTLRLAKGASSEQWTVAGLVEKHLATVGMVRPGKKEADTINLIAELPTPGYALYASVSPRPEQYCAFRIQVVALDGAEPRPVDAAPWWAQDALESVSAGVGSLKPPRRPPLDELRFATLHAEAAQLARDGKDPPLSANAYIHAARPITATPIDYYAPPTGPSQWVAPQ